MRERVRNMLRPLPNRVWLGSGALLAAILGAIVQRVADRWIPPGTESTYFTRALEWARDMLTFVPTSILLAFAAGVLLPYIWEERKRWLAALKRARNWRATRKKARADMARRWVALADEILADLPAIKGATTFMDHPREMPQEEWQRLWRAEMDRQSNESRARMGAAERKFLGRIENARLEMIRERIELRGIALSDRAVLVNPIGFELWARKLATEGTRILVELGEKP